MRARMTVSSHSRIRRSSPLGQVNSNGLCGALESRDGNDSAADRARRALLASAASVHFTWVTAPTGFEMEHVDLPVGIAVEGADYAAKVGRRAERLGDCRVYWSRSCPCLPTRCGAARSWFRPRLHGGDVPAREDRRSQADPASLRGWSSATSLARAARGSTAGRRRPDCAGRDQGPDVDRLRLCDGLGARRASSSPWSCRACPRCRSRPKSSPSGRWDAESFAAS